MKHYKVQSKKAPAPVNFRNRGSKWRDLFESMKQNDWFSIPEEGKVKTNAAANTYLKGRYSLYRVDDDSFCFIKLR